MAGRRRGQIEEERIPVLPARDTVHFPGLVNTLHVLREPSVKAVRKSLDGDGIVLVLSQRDMAIEDPDANALFEVGTLSQALQAIPLPDGSLRVALRGLRRVKARTVIQDGSFAAAIEEIAEGPAEEVVAESLMRACLESFTRIVELNKAIPPEALEAVVHVDEPGLLADSIAHHLPIRPTEKQRVLETFGEEERLEEVLRLLRRELQVLDLSARIHERVDKELGNSQREFYLREQLKVIQDELHEREDRVGEVEEYRLKIEASGMPEEAAEKALAEVRRLDRTPASSPEGMVSRNYLDTLISLPWATLTEDRLDVGAAAGLLDERHYGLEQVKDRVLDYLAVRQLKGSLRGPILCFLGPPGVGKTSIGRSIAEAMGRRFVRIALGGVRDETEIRGHRRTYVGSMPGRIIQGLRDCGSRNPVIVLDEIDKMSSGAQGDPTSALLEALDPEQNERFSDHYIEAPFDLTGVMFVATANLIDNVPPALRDRMEIIPFRSYTDRERSEIALRFLFPSALEEHGLAADQVQLPEASVRELVEDYTREAGVRNLSRHISTLCRKAARRVAEHGEQTVVLDSCALRRFLGHPRYRRNPSEGEGEVGTACGMAVSEYGGELISVEVSLTPTLGPRPDLLLTGNLGEVMKESAHAALTYLRAHIDELAPGRSLAADAHIHIPDAALPKDGPSAGLTVAVALASAFSDRPVNGNFAMTGEITLRGRVLPVGGIREKVLAASRAGMTDVIVPDDNAPDLDDVPAEVLSRIRVHRVKNVDEALSLVLV